MSNWMSCPPTPVWRTPLRNPRHATGVHLLSFRSKANKISHTGKWKNLFIKQMASIDNHARDGSETGSVKKKGKQKSTTDIGANFTPDFRDKEEHNNIFNCPRELGDWLPYGHIEYDLMLSIGAVYGLYELMCCCKEGFPVT